jgi:D-glycero-beta-D-manno-heptose 1-phosphate adenylyltransferase
MHLDIIKKKIQVFPAFKFVLNQWRFKDEKIVFTNGCFDILHQGHIDYLSKAADLGTKLIVGVNTDSSVRRLGKGKSRPIQDEQSRALIIAALGCVSAVVIFDEDTPYELIKIVQPHILVKGSDYTIDQVAGADIVINNGGRVALIDYLPGYSTSAIEKRIKAAE